MNRAATLCLLMASACVSDGGVLVVIEGSSEARARVRNVTVSMVHLDSRTVSFREFSIPTQGELPLAIYFSEKEVRDGPWQLVVRGYEDAIRTATFGSTLIGTSGNQTDIRETVLEELSP